MANEINLTASLSVYKNTVMSAVAGRSLTRSFTMTGNYMVEGVMTVATSATAIPLGSVTTPHWAFFFNTDSNNYLTIRNGASGADLLKLLAGECAFCPLLDSSTPYAVANTASIVMEYMIISL